MQIRSVGIDLGKTTFHLVALSDLVSAQCILTGLKIISRGLSGKSP